MTTGLWQDVRGAVRALLAMRGAGLLAILTLAIGIGATTAIFSIVYAALFRPLPFDESSRLAVIALVRSSPASGAVPTRFSFGEFTALADAATSFETVAAATRTSFLSAELPDPIPVAGEFVSPSYWSLLRLRPGVGRLTSVDDDGRRGTGAVAVISDRLWRDHFAGDPDIVGHPIRVNGVALEIIGVLAGGFNGLSERADIWMPATIAPRLTYAEYLTTPQHFIAVFGRLRQGVSIGDANRELAVLGPRIANGGRPDDDRSVVWSASATLANEARLQPAVRRSALLLLGTIVCILLIACANVASVLIARAHDRGREVAVRRALGAGSWRLVRQLLAESTLLVGAAGSLGLLLAMWGVRLAQVAAPNTFPATQTGYVQLSNFATPAFDPPVFTFFAVATIAGIVIFGLIPAWESSRPHVAASLRDDARTGSRRRLHTLHAVVVAEIAAAIVLVAGAGVLVESARGLERQRAGFDVTDVITFRVAPPASRYRPGDGPAILERLLTSIQSAPGVRWAAVNRCAPLDDGCARSNLHHHGPGEGAMIERHYISADYFQALAIPIKAGRGITTNDWRGSPLVTVVNERTAHRFWPGQNPVGQHVWFGNPPGFDDPNHQIEIVGVVGDVKYGTIDSPELPDFYTSYLQFAYPDSMIIVKTEPGRGISLLPEVRQAIASVDRGLAIQEPRTLDTLVQAAWVTPRFHAATVVTFAALALLLAAIGVYGVATVAVATRAREMGIRLAVGADARDVIRLVLAEHLRLGLIGCVIGLAGAIAVSRLLQSFLYDVPATDPKALTLALVTLTAIVLLGTLRPARRAGAINPVELLRRE